MATMERRTCPVCGTVYMVNAERLDKHGRGMTCSKTCSYELRSRNARQSRQVACAVCGVVVERTAGQLAKPKYGAVFCSRACHYKGRSLGLTKRIVTKPYASKGRPLKPKTQSRARTHPRRPVYKAEVDAAPPQPVRPATAYRSTRPQRRVYHWTTCTTCGREFDDPSDGRSRKSGKTFCSLACCNSFRKGAHNPAWRGGYPGYYGPDWRALRRAAWQRDGYACRRCGKTREQAGRRPDVHHIVPVGSFAVPNDANVLENLICTCHSCHMYVEWHGIDFDVHQPDVAVDVPKLRRARVQKRCHDPIACACGCGTMIAPYSRSGHRRRFVINHDKRRKQT